MAFNCSSDSCPKVAWSKFDICMSVHCNIITNYSQQDATFLEFIYFTDALHVSGGSSAHHQEHITVHTALGIVKPILLLAAIVEEMELLHGNS
jgi:hypothetical protein